MRILRSKAVWLIAVLTGAGFLWRYVIADRLAERRWEEYAQEARARGLRLTIAEYRPAPVPPDEDIARLPVFAASKDYDALLKKVPFLLAAKKRGRRELRDIDWKETRQHWRESGGVDNPAETDDVRAIDAALRPLQPIVDQLCNSKATAGNWSENVWRANAGNTAPAESNFMNCFRLLRVRASLDLEMGNVESARRAIEAQLRLTQAIAKAPGALVHMTATAGIFQAQENVWRGIEMERWDEAALRAFADVFLRWNWMEAFQWSMETERAWGRDRMQWMLDHNQRVLQSINGSGKSKMDEWLLKISASRPAWLYDNHVWCERAHDELAGMFDVKKGTWQPIDRHYDPAKLSSRQRNVDLALAAIVTDTMHSLMQKSVWLQAQTKMAAIACALELSRRKNGRVPDDLAALAPDYLSQLPIDPMTGANFRYVVQPNDSYLLYSVGFDRQDQGGKGEESEPSGRDVDWSWWIPRKK